MSQGHLTDSEAATALREQAEQRLRSMADTAATVAHEDARRLLHELQVHQIELEMQNEELLAARQAEQELLTRLTNLYDFAPIPYVVLDEQGVIDSLNHAAARFLGADRASFTGVRLGVFVSQDSRTSFNTVLERALASGVSEDGEIEFSIQGSTAWVVMRVLIESPGPRLLVALEDITQRKQTEQALLERKRQYRELNAQLEQKVQERTQEMAQLTERLQLAMEATQDGLWDWNLQTNEVYYNAAYLKMLGYEPADLAQDANGLFFDLLHPDEREDVCAKIHEYLVSPGHYKLEFRMRDRLGRYHWIISRGKLAERDAAGAPLRAIGTHTDITQRKEAGLALTAQHILMAESKAQLEKITSRVPGVVYQFVLRADGSSCFPYASEGIREIYRVNPEQVREDASAVFAVLHPDDYDRIVRSIEESARTLKPWELEYRVRFEDGTVRWNYGNSIPEPGPEGSIVWYGYIYDITDRKLAALALAESEARFRHMADFAPVMIWMSGLDGLCNYFNLTWLTFTGRTQAQECGNGWADGVHPADLERCLYIYETSFKARKAFSMDYRLKRHDGVYRWVEDKGRPRVDSEGNFLGYIGSAIDIQDRKFIEEYMRVMVETSTNALLLMDDTGRIELANDQLGRLFGYRTADMLGQPVEILVPVQQRHHHVSLQEYFLEAPEPREMGKSRTVRGQRQDGTIFPIEIVLSPIFVNERNWVICSITDVSERKRLETELDERIRQLEEADRHKTEFLAILAHELRNPLSALSNAGFLVQKGGISEDRREWFHDIIRRQTSHLARLVDDLLDISRISSGKIALNRQPVELAKVVQQAIQTCRALIDGGGHHLTIQLPSEPLVTEGDPDRLAQVLANLLNNAAKFTPPGGQISLVLEKQADQAVMIVKDNGIGIAPEMQDAIFGLFAQADTSLTKHHGGLGIGLNLARQLIGLHDGAITVYSEGCGKGSEFVIKLPLIAQPLTVAPDTRTTESERQISHRILVVDDNVDAATTLGMLLQFKGHEVHIAHNGLQALKLGEALQPGLMILDIGMPGMDGYELCRRIREQPWGVQARLIALTGWGQSDDKLKAMEAGFDEHLTKPVAPEDLDALLG